MKSFGAQSEVGTTKTAKRSTRKATSPGREHTVLLQPYITERSYQLQEMGKYMFVVAPKATKKDVKRAVEGIYDVTVTNVHVIVKKPKTVSFRGFSGRRPAKKTAIVTLKKGQEITLVESA